MSKNPVSFLCNECGKGKDTTNHWYILVPTLRQGSLIIMAWDETKANEDVQHLCGASCALKALSKELTKFYPDRSK